MTKKKNSKKKELGLWKKASPPPPNTQLWVRGFDRNRADKIARFRAKFNLPGTYPLPDKDKKE